MMKKIVAILLLALMACTFLASCGGNDGKCDTCGEAAVDSAELKAAGIKGEYCVAHAAEEALKAAADALASGNLGDLF